MPDVDNVTVNGNLDPTYTGLAPMPELQEGAVNEGQNPNQFVFSLPQHEKTTPMSPNMFTYDDGEPKVQELPSGPVAVLPDVPNRVTSSVPRKRSKRKVKDANTG